jgi:nicotinate-nucleotide adenylyltransferase
VKKAPGGKKRLRVGVYGGTFNPVHMGHLVLAEHIRELFRLQRVLFVPSGTPPHKAGRFPAARSRLHMVRLAVEGNRAFQVLDMEVRRRGPSYTVETLRELRRTFREDAKFFFLIGMDAFREFTTWHEASALTALADFIVFPRPLYPLEDPGPFLPPPRPGPPAAVRRGIRRYSLRKGSSLYLAEAPLIDIASTDIRSRLRRGRSVRYLVPDSEARYIDRRKLYR